MDGPNGSGKTTLTKEVLNHVWGKNCHYINPDDVAKEMFGDWNNPDCVLKAAIECSKQRYDDIANGKSLIFETVFSSDEKVDFVYQAKAKGYFVRLFYICTDCPEINVLRILRRYSLGGHMVPSDKVLSRYYKSLANMQKVIRDVDRCYLYDNSIENNFPKLVLRTSFGEIIKTYCTDIPHWMQNLYMSFARNYESIYRSGI